MKNPFRYRYAVVTILMPDDIFLRTSKRFRTRRGAEAHCTMANAITWDRFGPKAGFYHEVRPIDAVPT